MAECSSEFNYSLVKLLIIGDSKVGKSSIVLQFVDSKFDPTCAATIGVDFRTKILTIDNEKIKVDVWDTAGQERFRTITKSYYRSAMGVLLVYDVTDINSFGSIRDWLRDIKTNASEDMVIMLVGNKIDKETERVISHEEGAALAREIGCPFFETSAVTGKNIMEAFKSMSKLCKDKLENDAGSPADSTCLVSVRGDERGSRRCSKCSRRTEVVNENPV